jgi:hypothetical protein
LSTSSYCGTVAALRCLSFSALSLDSASKARPSSQCTKAFIFLDKRTEPLAQTGLIRWIGETFFVLRCLSFSARSLDSALKARSSNQCTKAFILLDMRTEPLAQTGLIRWIGAMFVNENEPLHSRCGFVSNRLIDREMGLLGVTIVSRHPRDGGPGGAAIGPPPVPNPSFALSVPLAAWSRNSFIMFTLGSKAGGKGNPVMDTARRML